MTEMKYSSEDKLRNKRDDAGDSLAEKKKMKQGVDIEPEADEWVAKPTGYIDPDHNTKN